MADPKINVVIGASTSEFAKGVSAVKAEINRLIPADLTAALTSPVAAAAASLGAMVKVFDAIIERAERIERIAARADVTRRQAAAIDRAARETGIQPDQLTSYITFMKKATGEALAGDDRSSFAQAFRGLGISREDLASNDPMDTFTRIISLFQQGGYSARQFADANQVLGRSFSDLLPAIRKGLPGRMSTAGLDNMALARGELMENRSESMKRGLGTMWDSFLNFSVNQSVDWARGLARIPLGVAGGEAFGQLLDRYRVRGLDDQNALEESQRRGRWAQELQELRNRGVSTGEMQGPPIPIYGRSSLAFKSADSLARIGLFRGGSDSTHQTLQQQLIELRAIVAELKNQTHIATSE